MKKFLIKVLFFLCFCIMLSVAVSYIVDPYNVFHWDNIRINGVEPNRNYIKTKYILANPDKYNGLMFGSSRVGSIHVEKMKNYKIYNMSYASGTPQEHYDTLKTFIDNKVKPDIVYLGVDNVAYTESPESHHTKGSLSQYQYLESPINFIRLYFAPNLVIQSLPTIQKSRSKNSFERNEAFYDFGWWCDYNIKSNYNWSKASPSIGNSYRLTETLQEISNIKKLCMDNGIKLIVFTNPMYDITYKKSVNDLNYYEFLRGLADITDFYNFSGLNEITRNKDNFVDTSHYNAYVGDKMIDVMCNGILDEKLYSEGFGKYITDNNVNELIELLIANDRKSNVSGDGSN